MEAVYLLRYYSPAHPGERARCLPGKWLLFTCQNNNQSFSASPLFRLFTVLLYNYVFINNT